MSREHDRKATFEVILFLGICVGALAGLYAGWKLFWFLTDDAYIAFRYVSNSMLGHGYVWNAPPFQPVEGYTSFLWVVVLDLTWRMTGIEPPNSANAIAFVFSCLTLIASALILFRIDWTSRLRRCRLAFVAALMVFLLLNRSYLAWSSSGLETAMFCFFVTSWIFVFISRVKTTTQVFVGSLAATCITLTRPDGLLYCLTTLLIVGLLALRAGDRKHALRIVLNATPMLIVVIHGWWRYAFYGSLLPNTYYAKVVEAWPQSGARYALSFVMEYALWFVFAIFAWVGGTWLAAMARKPGQTTNVAIHVRAYECLMKSPVATIGVTATLLIHVAYYTLIVGGDHFEYRVYNHIIPFCFIAFVWGLNRLHLSRGVALALTIVFILLSLPVQWTQWALAKERNTRRDTHMMIEPIAQAWPLPVRWYANVFDDLQSWLILHHAGMRHQEHKIFWKFQVHIFPSREEGSSIPPDGYPVFPAPAVGVPAWVMPHVNIMDTHGLNDRVIARMPVPAEKVRLMAHSRQPPRGYIESFRPNVALTGEGLITSARQAPLTEREIVELEAYWWERREKADVEKRRTGSPGS